MQLVGFSNGSVSLLQKRMCMPYLAAAYFVILWFEHFAFAKKSLKLAKNRSISTKFYMLTLD